MTGDDTARVEEHETIWRSDSVEAVREVLVTAGFPAEDWSDDEIRVKWVFVIEAMSKLNQAMQAAFADLADQFHVSFERLAIIAEEIEKAERRS